MSNQSINLPRHIAARYVSVGKRSQLVSFMSAIAIGGLAFGTAILITVLSVMNGFDQEMRQNILGIVPHLTLSSSANLNAEQWQEIQTIAESQSQVESTSPLIETGGVLATPAASQGVIVNGVAGDDELQFSVIGRFFRSGSLQALQEQRWNIAIGATLAEQLGVAVGDQVDLFSTAISLNPLTPLPTYRSFTVSGIFAVGNQDIDERLVLVNIESARALFRLRTPYNSLRVRLDDVLVADSVADGLRGDLPDSVSLTTWTRQYGSIYENIRFSRSIISLMLWMLVGVAAFNLVVSLIMIVRDKRGDIAILRTQGASPGMISRIFMWQGGFIAAMGMAIGLVLGVIGALQISNFASFIERVFDLQLLSADVYPIDFLPSALRISDIVSVLIGVFLLSLLATYFPARRAAAIQPAEALRAD